MIPSKTSQQRKLSDSTIDMETAAKLYSPASSGQATDRSANLSITPELFEKVDIFSTPIRESVTGKVG
jgi:hypothetical protein